MRQTLGVCIAAFWIFMMSLLVWRHLLPAPAPQGGAPAMSAAKISRDWHDTEEWMRISIGGRPAGVAMAAEHKAAKGYTAISRIHLTLLGAFNKAMNLESVASLDADFHLSAFHVIGSASPLALDIRGIVWENRLLISMDAHSGQPRRGYYPLAQPIVLMDSLRPLAGHNIELKEGNVYRFPAFDPLWSGMAGDAVLRVGGKEKIQVGGKTVLATKLETTMAGQEASAWVGPDQSMLRYQFMNNIVFEKSDRAEGLKIEPSWARTDLDPPAFGIEEFAHNDQLIDLSKQSPLAMISQLFMGAGKTDDSH